MKKPPPKPARNLPAGMPKPQGYIATLIVFGYRTDLPQLSDVIRSQGMLLLELDGEVFWQQDSATQSTSDGLLQDLEQITDHYATLLQSLKNKLLGSKC